MENPFSDHQSLMDSLKARHLDILRLIDGKRVHLLDVPVYGNVGDLLILKGTEIFFEKNKVNVVQVASVYNFQDKVKPGDVLAFQGGGNFGDLYGLHQTHREELIKKYPENRIIILPQSIFFQSETAFAQCAAELRQHRDLHIFVRDEKSLQSAQQMTDNCYLVPDMAHHLYSATVKPKNSGKRLLFKRLDKESTVANIDLQWHTKTDWDLLIKNELKTIDLFRRLLRKSKKLNMDWLVMRAWLVYKNILIAKAEKFFLKHDFVITDRLHGHILASLLNTPNCVLDNSYGKNSNYVKAWTNPSPFVSLHTN